MNEWLVSQDIHTGFRLGIGLHSGTLMSGNVGSPRRLEYAAVGDTTNTAARVESLTKEHDVALLLTESVVEMLTRPVDGLRFVAEVAPRGRSGSVRLWTYDEVAT
jgi:adenylate cyclase